MQLDIGSRWWRWINDTSASDRGRKRGSWTRVNRRWLSRAQHAEYTERGGVSS